MKKIATFNDALLQPKTFSIFTNAYMTTRQWKTFLTPSNCLDRSSFSTRAKVEQLVTERIHFYNFERISLRSGLTLLEFREGRAKYICVIIFSPFIG